MPEALMVDREPVKALYIQGQTIAQLAKQFDLKESTISNWVCREKWGKLRQHVNTLKPVKAQAMVSVKVSEPSVKDSKSELIRGRLADELDRTLGALSDTKAGKSLNHLSPRAATLTKLAETASKVFGWGNDSVTIQFGVSMLSDAAEPIPAQVTDVTPQEQPTKNAGVSEQATTGSGSGDEKNIIPDASEMP